MTTSTLSSFQGGHAPFDLLLFEPFASFSLNHRVVVISSDIRERLSHESVQKDHEPIPVRINIHHISRDSSQRVLKSRNIVGHVFPDLLNMLSPSFLVQPRRFSPVRTHLKGLNLQINVPDRNLKAQWDMVRNMQFNALRLQAKTMIITVEPGNFAVRLPPSTTVDLQGGAPLSN